MKTKLLGGIKAPLYLVANLFIIIGMAFWISFFYLRKYLKIACTPLWKSNTSSTTPVMMSNRYNPKNVMSDTSPHH